MSNQIKDQIYVRTVPTNIDIDKKEASQNCKIKNIETNNVDTLETVSIKKNYYQHIYYIIYYIYIICIF